MSLDRWQNKIAVVTGASSGIGAAITTALVNAGLVVVGLARRIELIEQLKNELPSEKQANLHAFKCDVSDGASINTAFDWIIERFGGVDVLVNNAGYHHDGQLVEMDFALLENIVQTNFLGAVFCTQRAFNSMRERKVNGHVFMMNSITGHSVPVNLNPNYPPIANIYPSAKFALRAATEMFRQEFNGFKTKVKITSISPGFVNTALISPDIADIIGEAILQPKDVADSLIHALFTPPNVQIHDLVIKPVGELF